MSNIHHPTVTTLPLTNFIEFSATTNFNKSQAELTRAGRKNCWTHTLQLKSIQQRGKVISRAEGRVQSVNRAGQSISLFLLNYINRNYLAVLCALLPTKIFVNH